MCSHDLTPVFRPDALEGDPIYEVIVRGGGMWSKVVGRHKTLTLTDLDGGANVSMLFFNARNPVERYNMPDTLKGQHLFRLTAPACIHSDMGRLFCSITADTMGWHDTVCGCSDAALVQARYGGASYQECRNDFHRNGRDCFLTELGKWGLGERDLVPNVNFFSRVEPDPEGKLTFQCGASPAGSHIDLRFEMDTLIVLNTCPHPLDPSATYAPGAVKLSIRRTPPPGQDDPCRTSCPENSRAMLNTEITCALQD